MHGRSHPAFTRFAWAFVAYLLLVILFGAWVRITHSGAGCGSHWPTCNGDIVPLAPSVETVIEYTHRLTSGLLGIFGLVLVAGAARAFGRDRVTAAAVVTLVFIVVEALIGAGLVLEELVADDDSVARAIVIAVHLVNTLVLTASAALMAWWSFDRRPNAGRLPGRAGALLVVALLAIVATSLTGAVTALGDTLFPVDTTAAQPILTRVRADLSPAKHFLVRLRIVHPIVAVVAAVVLTWIAAGVQERARDALTRRLATGLRHAVVTQILLGVANIALAAPGWLQLGHLLVAQMVWLAAVLTFASARGGGLDPHRVRGPR